MRIVALLLALFAVSCTTSSPPAEEASPAWTEADTIVVLRQAWDDCRATGTDEDACEAHVRSVAAFFPSTVMPLTPCFAQCASNVFCADGILPRCRFCGFGGICGVSQPQLK